MQKLIAILTFCFCTGKVSAQQNVLAQSPIRLLNHSQWQEHRGSHYFLARQSKAIYGFNGRGPASRFDVVKMKVSNNTISASRYVYGDTVQVDTYIHPHVGQAMLVSDGKVHLFYNKATLIDSTTNPITGVYQLFYQALDTNLNVIIPEILLSSESSLDTTFLKDAGIIFLTKVQSNLLLITARANSAGGSFLTEYRLLTQSGVVLRKDTFNKAALAAQSLIHSTAEAVVPYGAANYLVIGRGLQQYLQPVLLLTDTNLQTLDSFEYTEPILGPPGNGGYYPKTPSLQVLPNGSIATAGMFIYNGSATPVGLATQPSLIALHRPGNGFKQNKTLVLGEKDSADYSHATGGGPSYLVYQPADDRVYYLNHTHADIILSSGFCYGPDNYLEIACTDTALNLRWRKYIYAGTYRCNISSKLASCDGRSGVMVVGSSYSTINSTNINEHRDFAYHVDSAATFSVIAGPNEAALRDRIALYPNPAHEDFIIDDVLSGLVSYEIYDSRGKLVQTRSVIANEKRTTVHVADFAPSLYLIRVFTKDGAVSMHRMLKL